MLVNVFIKAGISHVTFDNRWTFLTASLLTGGGVWVLTLLLICACGIGCLGSLFSACSVTVGFFFFSLAKIDDSLSGNGGISSSTVA